MPVDEFYSDKDYWDQRWKNNSIEFHCQTNHKLLVKHLEKLTNNRENLKFFFPLCGKALDMAWLSSFGHSIVGVEFSPDAVEDFFKENKIDYKTCDLDKFKIYQSLDGRIKIYRGDFFDFNSNLEDSFDCVWDRGALVALPKEQRKKFAQIVCSILKPEFRYILDAFDYDSNLYQGPPHVVTLEEIQILYGSKCKIELIDKNEYHRIFSESLKDKPPVELLYLLSNF
ncbi:thiopurine S-methyltransferase [Brachionus plicatilis]|uniref:thiopurine S-methyltransferase n=1 Tax=Brachionus plicatilis TaxID=10195 RepID=A0A3M7P5A5_BRAPC|nr:thiopurine S-methyltransferase [Brachionus plicatilis]